MSIARFYPKTARLWAKTTQLWVSVGTNEFSAYIS